MSSQATRDRILRAALGLFRKKGFDKTTMRDVARAAKASLGSAYYYFPSKEAFVLAHWEDQMDEHERRARAVFAESDELGERIRAVLFARIDLMKHDQRLLVGMFRGIADAESPVSVFGPSTASLRERSVALFREAVSVEAVPDDLRDGAALGLWVLMLGIVLYFVHDRSGEHANTRKLADGAVELLLPLLPLLSLEPAREWRERLMKLLADVGLSR